MKNLAFEFDFEYRGDCSSLHLAEMRELPLRLRKGGTVTSYLSQHSRRWQWRRARATLWNEAMSLLRLVSVFAAWNGAAAGCEEAPK